MQLQSIQLPQGIRLLLLPDDRFASLQIKLWYAAPLAIERMTPAALLPLLLKRGSATFPSQRELAAQLENLWGGEVQAGVAKMAGQHLSSFELDMTDPRFLPGEAASSLTEGIRLLADLVQRPYLPNGSFAEDVFREEKTTLSHALARLRNHRSAYAMDRLMAELYPGEAMGINRMGRISDLAYLTPSMLEGYYAYFRHNARLTIGVTGAFDPQQVQEAIALAFLPGAGAAEIALPAPKKHAASVRHLREELPGEQSQLLMAFSSEIDYHDESSLPLLFLNGLWGAFAHSRLFRKLREEAGLAYSTWTRVDRAQGTVLAGAGIHAEEAEEAEEIVLRELASLQAGEISDMEWTMTMQTLLDQYQQLADDPNAQLEYFFNGSLLKRGLSVEETMAKVRALRREQVIETARRMQLHTVYLLAGNDDGDAEEGEDE